MRRLLLVAGLMATAGRGVTANDLCGTTITGDLRLDHDLVCAGNGLVVGADGIRIDLNGHMVAGSGGGVGILVVGRSDVTIANGVLRNFQAAVQLNASTGIVIRHNELVQNADGIDVQAGGVGNTVKENAFRNHTVRAIMLRGGSSDNDIKNNTFVANRIGILVNGATDTELKDNLVSESGLTGIRFNNAATGNTVKDNVLTSNLSGIEFVVAPIGLSVGNEFKGNTLSANGCGLLGLSAGNTFKDNTFDGNTANACP